MVHIQFSSVTQSCLTLCDPMNRSTPGLPVHHQHPESTQTHVHWVGDAIQPFHPLPSPSSPALNLSQHQGLFQWVSSLHQVAKVLEFQLQHQSFQWFTSLRPFRTKKRSFILMLGWVRSWTKEDHCHFLIMWIIIRGKWCFKKINLAVIGKMHWNEEVVKPFIRLLS